MISRVTAIIVISVGFFLNANPVLCQNGFKSFIAQAKKNDTHVRAGQNKNFESLCKLSRGEKVLVVGRDFSWLKIKLPLKCDSYIISKYVQPVDNNEGIVIAKDVNIRGGAGINYSSIGRLAQGKTVKIINQVNDWYKIEPTIETYGWVAEDLLAFVSDNVKAYKDESSPRIEGQEIIKPVDAVKEEPLSVKAPVLLTVTGILEKFESQNHDDIIFKLVIDGKAAYYIKTNNDIIGRFINYKVAVEGAIIEALSGKYDLPVIEANKVKLVL